MSTPPSRWRPAVVLTATAALLAAGLTGTTAGADTLEEPDPLSAETAPVDQVAAPPEIVVPEGAVELSEGDLHVRLHPDFPQVVDYRQGEAQIAGRLGDALTTVLVDESERSVDVAAPVVAQDGLSATYALTFPELPGVSMDAVMSLADEALTFRLTNLVDPQAQVHRVRIPHHDLVSVTSERPEAQLTAADVSVDRNRSGDAFEPLATTPAGEIDGSWMALASDGVLAAGLETNAVEDNTAGGETASRVQSDNNRYQRQIREVDGVKVGSIWAGTFTWRGSTADLGIGLDQDPFVTVKITGDSNDDDAVDWQDAAIAARDILTPFHGMEETADTVITRIPFNIVSQATHPFLRTLDDTKRIGLATENLGQQVLLKGYQAEGHDSAHPDYAGHYNERAGGYEDFVTLVEEGEAWNAEFGVHVNATESYSEAYSFSEDLLRMPPEAGWGWMNQSYYIDGPKDLGTGNVLDRFQALRDEAPENLSFLYVDVYYPSGWEAQRLSDGLQDQGWEITTEWANKFNRTSLWSHWANDENYGGETNKGTNSQVIRFVENSYRDTFNPHPILSNANIKEFEGWTGHVDYDPFIANVWERNLPVKFLQQSDIMDWEDGRITFENGTVATSEVESIDGRTVPTDRSFVFDGATVYEDGSYLLPWSDAESDRLYHWAPEGGTATWELTDAWADQGSLVMYELTDQGRSDRTVVPVKKGSVTLTAEAGTAYVLFPTGSVPEAETPDWGHGAGIEDPGFFSGGLDAWSPEGEVTVERSDRGNLSAHLGAGPATISQAVGDGVKDTGRKGSPWTKGLASGTWSAWAWVEIDPGEQRDVTVEVAGDGVLPIAGQAGEKGRAATMIDTSSAVNATASDEKLGTYFQRVRVTFETDGSPTTLRIAAGEGDATVRVDDVRIVPTTAPSDPAPTPETVLFEDFEDVDTGYWPFVTGSTNAGGDARTQLAEKHSPYSDRGWWGKDQTGEVVEGGKLIDNTLEGTWSLMAHEENGGLILRTPNAAVDFQPGHRYRVSFDHQTGLEDTYRFVVGHDRLSADGVTEEITAGTVVPAAHKTERFTDEFTADACGSPTWIGIEKIGGGYQADLVMDQLRVEDLGADPQLQACAAAEVAVDGTVTASEPFSVSTTVTSREGIEVTQLDQVLAAPEGWSVETVDAGPSTLSPGEAATATWSVTAPEGATEGELDLAATYLRGQDQLSVSADRSVTVLRAGESYLSDLRDLIVGEPVNGWGPIEFDTSNGEAQADDGTTLSIGGQTYEKGLGAHAVSTVTFGLDGRCTDFVSDVGVDDEVGARGAVVFSVLGDGEALAGPTGVLRGGDDPETVTADLTGIDELTLQIDAPEGVGGAHADWGGARITCG